MNHITKEVEYPKSLAKDCKKARRYEWITLIYMMSAALFSFLTMSNSQTMKTVYLEDLLGIIPPASFLLANKIVRWGANANFPYGFHRVTSMCYLSSSLSLFILGVYLFIDGLHVLSLQDHPTIGTFYVFDHSIWFGFLMILALLWSSIPSTFLAKSKIPLAKKLYDKILFSDADMNKASWMSGFASIVGIIGIGFGFWWADASMGILISLSIIHDGYSNLKVAILDLLDEVPKVLGEDKTEPLLREVTDLVAKENWVEEVYFRVRDDGHVFFGEIFVVPAEKEVSVDKIVKLKDKVQKYNWRLNDLVVMPVSGKM